MTVPHLDENDVQTENNACDKTWKSETIYYMEGILTIRVRAVASEGGQQMGLHRKPELGLTLFIEALWGIVETF